ncbi:hypothetical protein [Nonomuraea indica]|uniref:hypothetical protein n=1 Tax=Nonomuraea indica TaxID=1581193 RepID=UPI000C7A6FCC|nr:hypothetical protein [Nonomuraea indica]
MAALTLQVIGPELIESELVAASVGGDTCPAGDGIYLEVDNAGGSPITVTLATPGTVDGLAIADREESVPAGARGKVLVSRTYAKADGQCDITYSGVTSVTVGVFKVA